MNQRIHLRLPGTRRDAVIVGLILVASVAALLPGIAMGARSQQPPRLGEFLWGLAGQESGWDYTARNTWSGAYGKYQVMPANWPSWADRYVGDRWADQSPHNQELVVRGKIADLHRWLGTWRRVAYWWLTGDTQTDERRWSSVARGYVNNVTAVARRAPRGGDPIPPGPAGGAPPATRGDWRLVVEGAVLFDRVSGGRRQITRLRDGQVLFVQGSRWNHRGVLWMRASTAGDDVGWISIRRTVPSGRPAHADRWSHGGGITDPGPGRRPRQRARPQPR